MDDHETALASRVRSAISGEPDVEVEVDRETVTLRGHVRDARVIARLEEIVNRIEGVTSVNNRLVVGA